MRRQFTVYFCVARGLTRAAASPAHQATMPPGKSCEPPQCRDDAGGKKPLMTQTATRPAVRVEASPRWVRGLVNGVPIVDSKRVALVYGARRLATYFFPIADVRMDMLQPAE